MSEPTAGPQGSNQNEGAPSPELLRVRGGGLTAAQVAEATGCDPVRVGKNWPIIQAAAAKRGMVDALVQIAIAATVAVETAGTFEPIRERMANPIRQPEMAVRQAHYAPYVGRGYVQITWLRNYEIHGKKLGLDLVGNPDLALDPHVAADILADYFKDNGVDKAALTCGWRKVRLLVNGGYNHFDIFMGHVARMMDLLEIPDA